MHNVGVTINASWDKELQDRDACLLTEMPLFFPETSSLPFHTLTTASPSRVFMC